MHLALVDVEGWDGVSFAVDCDGATWTRLGERWGRLPAHGLDPVRPLDRELARVDALDATLAADPDASLLDRTGTDRDEHVPPGVPFS